MAEINKKPVKKAEEEASSDPMFWLKKSSFAVPQKEGPRKGTNLVGIVQKIAERNRAGKMKPKK